MFRLKKRLSGAAALSLAVSISLPGFMVRAEGISSGKQNWPVTVMGNELTVEYDGEDHVVSGFSVGTMPEGKQLILKDGIQEPRLTGTDPSEYELELDPDDFSVEGDNPSEQSESPIRRALRRLLTASNEITDFSITLGTTKDFEDTDANNKEKQDSQKLAASIAPFEFGNSKWTGFMRGFPEGYDDGY